MTDKLNDNDRERPEYKFDFNKIGIDEVMLRIKLMPKDEYKAFRKWLWEEHGYHTRMHLPMKDEVTIEYYFQWTELWNNN